MVLENKEAQQGKGPFYQGYPQPLWVQVDMLGLGDILVVKTQSSLYNLFIIGQRIGLFWADKESSQAVEVHIYGGYDLETSQPSWGKIQVGAPLLVAPVTTPSEAIKTSPVEALYIRKASLISPSVQMPKSPMATKSTATSPSGIRPLASRPAVSQPAPKALSYGPPKPLGALKPVVSSGIKPVKRY